MTTTREGRLTSQKTRHRDRPYSRYLLVWPRGIRIRTPVSALPRSVGGQNPDPWAARQTPSVEKPHGRYKNHTNTFEESSFFCPRILASWLNPSGSGRARQRPIRGGSR